VVVRPPPASAAQPPAPAGGLRRPPGLRSGRGGGSWRFETPAAVVRPPPASAAQPPAPRGGLRMTPGLWSGRGGSSWSFETPEAVVRPPPASAAQPPAPRGGLRMTPGLWSGRSGSSWSFGRASVVVCLAESPSAWSRSTAVIRRPPLWGRSRRAAPGRGAFEPSPQCTGAARMHRARAGPPASSAQPPAGACSPCSTADFVRRRTAGAGHGAQRRGGVVRSAGAVHGRFETPKAVV